MRQVLTEIAVTLDDLRELILMIHNKNFNKEDFEFFESAAFDHIFNIISLRDELFKEEN